MENELKQWARCTSSYIQRDYNVHTLCERKKTLNKKAKKVQTCLLPPTATTIGSSTVASLPFVLVSVPATSLPFFILLQVFICPDLCPCNKITQATFYLSFVLVWSLQQGPGLGPYNMVLVPTTRSSNAVCHLSCSVSLQQGHLQQFVILTDQCHLSFASCQVSWSSQATSQKEINK